MPGAIEEAAAAALESAGCAAFDAALLFATPHHASGLRALLDAAAKLLGTASVVGATGLGVLGAGREHEGVPALAVLGLADLEAHSFLFPDLRADGASIGDEIAAQLGAAATDRDLVILLPDPYALAPELLLSGVRSALGPARVVGAGAADAASTPPLQWCGSQIVSGGLSGLVVRAKHPPRVGVTQACRPVTELLTVTRTEGHWVLELDGRPALDFVREVARGPLADDLRRAAAFIFAALPRDPEAPLRPGGYLVRNLAGFEPARGAFALVDLPAPGQRLALALREPASAREDLKEMLAGLAGRRPAVGVYFDCCSRGRALFGMEGLEAAYLEDAFGDVPIAGMHGSCELGPIGGTTELLTYTGVLALLDA